MTTGGDWRCWAACRGVDPELFFPVGEYGPALAQIVRAKEVCAGCPVVAECLSFALVAIPEGVAGGLTGEERRVLRGKRRRKSGVPAGLPGGVDGQVVASLVAGMRVPGVSLLELAHAAVGLYRDGCGPGSIAARLGVDARLVYRWLERHRAGRPLVSAAGRCGRVSA
jgi:WhiB family transcriptional regulator, redox-sensing transcriptional regulator